MELKMHHFEAITIKIESAENQEMLKLVSESLMKNRIFIYTQNIPQITH